MKFSACIYCSAILLLSATVALTGCSESTKAEEQIEQEWPVKVTTPLFTGNEVNQRRWFAGRVKAVQSVELSFQVAGKLDYLAFREGEIVPKGKLIAALDSADYIRRVKEARVNLELLQKTLARHRSLAESGVIPQQQLDETRARYDLAKVALEQAERDLSYTKLKAPFDALVTRRLVENYTNVQAGQGIVQLQDISEVRIQISVPEDMLAAVTREGADSITATFELLPGREFSLSYREHQAEADSVTQTYTVELGMPRPKDVEILPGMTARVSMNLKGAESNAWIPLSAVQTNADGSPYVWRINDDWSVSKVPVTLGHSDGELVEVTSGLAMSVKLVAAGGQHLYDGARVRDYMQYSLQ